MNWQPLQDTIMDLECSFCFDSPQPIYWAAGIILLILWLYLRRRRRSAKILAFQSENGRVMVNQSAILELVQSVCSEIGQIHRVNAHIQTKRGMTHLRVSLQLSSDVKLKDLEASLQLQLRHALIETLGIDQLGDIDITATGFKRHSGKGERPGSNEPNTSTTYSVMDNDFRD